MWLKEKKALPFAGGTDLMVHYRNYSGTESTINRPVLFTDDISELHHITVEGDTLNIGASCLLSELEESPNVPDLLRKAISEIAAPALRNRATLAGNICNASPAGDSLPPLYVYDAAVILSSVRGSRTVPLEQFITGPGKTLLAEDELLTSIIIPLEREETVYYRKVGTRAANALSKLSVAGYARFDGKQLSDFRMAFGAVGPVVIRLKSVESLIIGKTPAELDIGTIKKAYGCHIKPIDDQRSTADYRKDVVLNLIEDFIVKLQEKI
jgi:CO/xanthine dehydrogenase FAD-binding subunit